MNSLWLDSIKNNNYESLCKDIETDVCIIGAGILGLSCGYYLSNKGMKVTIIDRNEISTRTTGHTTAKITSQHGLIYKYLIDSQGKKLAKQYLDANEEAIQNIKKVIEKEKINCDFEFQDSYIYTTDKGEVEKIKIENEAVNSLRF